MQDVRLAALVEVDNVREGCRVWRVQHVLLVRELVKAVPDLE